VLDFREFFTYAKSFPLSQRFFLMTDDLAYRRIFGDVIGYERLLLYNESSPNGGFATNICNEYDRRPPCYDAVRSFWFGRQTSLQHSIVEAMIAAHAKEFRGTLGSTMSELVHIFKGLIRLLPNCYLVAGKDCSKILVSAVFLLFR